MVFRSKKYVMRCYSSGVQRWYLTEKDTFFFHRPDDLPAIIKHISFYSLTLGLTEYWVRGKSSRFGME